MENSRLPNQKSISLSLGDGAAPLKTIFNKRIDGFSSTLQLGSIKIVAPLGSTQLQFPPNPLFLAKKGPLQFFVPSRSILSTFIATASNSIWGASYGYFIKFSFKGVGFKLQVYSSNCLAFDLGCSHYFVYKLPTGVFVKKIKKYDFVAFCPDRQLLGNVAADIQSLRYPDVYKGKGIHHNLEYLFLKSRNKDAKRR